jgi:hypothetical protein
VTLTLTSIPAFACTRDGNRENAPGRIKGSRGPLVRLREPAFSFLPSAMVSIGWLGAVARTPDLVA